MDGAGPFDREFARHIFSLGEELTDWPDDVTDQRVRRTYSSWQSFFDCHSDEYFTWLENQILESRADIAAQGAFA